MSFVQITRHVRERYLERKFSEFKHLDGCVVGDCIICTNLKYKIKYKAESDKKILDAEIRNQIIPANRNNSLLNNSSFMEYFYADHGFDSSPEFYMNDGMIFVICQKSSLRSVVTCMKVGSKFLNQPLSEHKKYKVCSK